jgi:hypothetical protein
MIESEFRLGRSPNFAYREGALGKSIPPCPDW